MPPVPPVAAHTASGCLAGLPLGYPHAIAFVLAAIGVLMQWMWSEPAQARMS
jgi:hypothetical protein